MDKCFTKSKRRSQPSTARGFTLPELIVAITVMGIIMGLVIPMVLGVREGVRADQLRTGANQRVREASDLIGADVRIAGERFPAGTTLQLQPLEIVDGGAGPDELIIRRSLWAGTLPVCENNLQGAGATIRVVRDNGWLGSPEGQGHPECGQPVGADGWPRNLSEVRALADEVGIDGVLQGFLFDPANDVGEFISFEVEDNANLTGQIRRTNGGSLQGNYLLENRPLIYVLSERRYRVAGEVLELLLDGGEAPLRAVPSIINFRARFVLDGGVTAAALPAGVSWRDIQGVELTLTSRTEGGGDENVQTLTSSYFPRNVLSR